MQTINQLSEQFLGDLRLISEKLISEYNLNFEKNVDSLSDPLLRWLDFVLRYIPAVPRSVLFSNKFPKNLDREAEIGLVNIVKLIEQGADLNPFQTKNLRINDVSSKKRQERTDLLWADRGIHHLHIPTSPDLTKNGFSKRSSFLIFCFIYADAICVIDILGHDYFSKDELFKIAIESWPDLMKPYEISGALPGRDIYSDSDIYQMRKSGVGSLINVDGKLYFPPGGGICSASLSGLIPMQMNKIHRWIRELSEFVYAPAGYLKECVEKLGIAEPDFSLGLNEKGFYVFESKSRGAYLLQRAKTADEICFLSNLYDAIAPAWVVEYLEKKHRVSE